MTESSARVPIVAAGNPGSVGMSAAAPGKRRVLFVDDEAPILDGLRAVLRPQRREWEMVFALGGQAGLEEIKRQAFDVVVTDMRMPVVDGAELLRQVKELQPRCVRIVLSGQTDAETAMRTVFTAHQFLSKPCDIDKVRGVIRRACALNELVSAETLKALAGDVSMLPAMPRTYSAISQALANPGCSMAEVARIVERDPALCAKVLQVVNSAFFGLPRSVSSVAQAANYLGTLTLRNLSLAMETVVASRQSASSLSAKELLAFQVNSLLVASLGRFWFGSDRRKADEAFVAGMLRDMGHLLIPHPPDPAVAAAHGALSAYLLGLWGIPHAVQEPVAFHEYPERVEHDCLEVVDVVHLADRVAHELAPSPFAPADQTLDVARLERLGASSQQLQLLRERAKELLAPTRELLGS